LFTKGFWRDTLERMARTFAQTMVATLGATTFNAFHVSWPVPLGISVGAAFLCFLTCVIAAPKGDKNSASFLTPTTNSEPASSHKHERLEL